MKNTQENTVVEVRDNGRKIVLFDGSKWSVSEGDSVKTALWYPTQRIIIEESDNDTYPFTLINLDTFPVDQVGASRMY
jgi:hypothetical protein